METHKPKSLLALAAALLIAAVAPAPAATWWRSQWKFRRVVTIDKPVRRSLPGDDIAVATLPTGGQMRPDGADIRVLTPTLHQQPSRVLMVGPGDVVRVAFATRRGVQRYYVYYGNPTAKPPKSRSTTSAAACC